MVSFRSHVKMKVNPVSPNECVKPLASFLQPSYESFTERFISLVPCLDENFTQTRLVGEVVNFEKHKRIHPKRGCHPRL